MNDAVILLNNLVKRFAGMDKPAVAPLNCTIQKGYVTGLVGPDGAGKTTLMRMLAGLLKPDEGSARVLGLDPIEDDGALHAMLGYMPQKFGLYEDLTVMENLNLYADLRSVTGETREKTFARLLEFTSLGPFTDRLAGKLSGGMKQKLGLACTLVGEPKVLLLDEPGVGVDPISRRELWQMVHELAGDGMLILWSTSYLDEAEQCRDVLLMNEGELLYQGEPTTLTQSMAGRPANIVDGGLFFENYPYRAALDHPVADLRQPEHPLQQPAVGLLRAVQQEAAPGHALRQRRRLALIKQFAFVHQQHV
ncbi:ABC transporter ATP-binding protein, partial [Enterobacter asburiae]|uniref:ABC transporter ATP-binding protein n=1 Tax=Enterobacter asburiae TaxID=61645 RepID=UPI0039C0778E